MALGGILPRLPRLVGNFRLERGSQEVRFRISSLRESKLLGDDYRRCGEQPDQARPRFCLEAKQQPGPRWARRPPRTIGESRPARQRTPALSVVAVVDAGPP
jgi:hypothetical protein